MAKVIRLIFSLFNVALGREVSFGILLYVQCILHGLTSALLCVPFILATVKIVDSVVACDGLLFVTENIILATLITQLLSNTSQFVLVGSRFNTAGNKT